MVFDQTASILVKVSQRSTALAMVLDPDRLNGLGLNAAKSLIDFAMKVQQEISRKVGPSRSNVGGTEQCQFIVALAVRKRDEVVIVASDRGSSRTPTDVCSVRRFGRWIFLGRENTDGFG